MGERILRTRNPGPYLPDEPPEFQRPDIPDRTLELMFQPIDRIGRADREEPT